MSEVAKLEKTLRKQTASADVETSKITSTAERILTHDPHHVYALQCKSVALMHAGKQAAALRVLDSIEKEKTPYKTTSTFYFHKAYCHYRLMEYAEAKATLRRQQGSPSTPARHLLAQIHYNLEEYAQAAAMYAALLKDKAYCNDTERQELLTNYTAALSASDPVKVTAVVRDDVEEKTPDLLFNLAVAQLEVQNYDGAQTALAQAEQLCARDFPKSSLHSLQQALSEDQEVLQTQLGLPVLATGAASLSNASAERRFFNEVSSNWVQQAYLWVLRHREEEARRAVDLILTYKPASAVTHAVASLLWTALQRSGDFFDSHRKLKTAQHVKVASRLTSRQIVAVQYNTALLHLSAGSLHRCAKVVEQMEKTHPNSELTQSLRLVLAVRELRRKKNVSAAAGDSAGNNSNASAVQECVRQYGAEVTKRQGSQSNTSGASEADRKKHQRFIQLIAAQLFLEQGDVAHAAEAVETMDDAALVHRPATVLTLASWRVQSGAVEGALKLLKERLTSTDSYSAELKKAMLMWVVNDLAVGRGLYVEVATLVKAVQAADSTLAKDREVVALLVLCLAQTNLSEAKAHIAVLDSQAAATVSGSSSGGKSLSDKEVQSLVQRNPGPAAMSELGYRRVTAADQEEAAAAAAAGIEMADSGSGRAAGKGGLPRRRCRALRRPAKSMEGKPDPERWIPMSMRSYIKDLPERRKKELKRLRAIDQEQKRRAAAARLKKAAEETAAVE